MRNRLADGDDVRLVEASGRTVPAAEPLDEAPVAIERRREDLDRDNAPDQTVVSLVHVGHPPAGGPAPRAHRAAENGRGADHHTTLPREWRERIFSWAP